MDAFTQAANSQGYPSIRPRAATGYGALIPPTVGGAYGRTVEPISVSQPNVAPDVVVFSFEAVAPNEKKRLSAMKKGTIVGINTLNAGTTYDSDKIVKMDETPGIECLDSVFITVLMSDWTTYDFGSAVTYSGTFVVQGACAVTLPEFVGREYNEGGTFRVSAHADNDDLPPPRAYKTNVEHDDPDKGNWPKSFVALPINKKEDDIGLSEYGYKRSTTDGTATWNSTDYPDGKTKVSAWKFTDVIPMQNDDIVPYVWQPSGELRQQTEKYTIKAGIEWPRVFRSFTLLTRPVQIGDGVYTARCDVGMHANYAEFDGLSANETYALVYKTPPIEISALERDEDRAETARVGNNDMNYNNANWRLDVPYFNV